MAGTFSNGKILDGYVLDGITTSYSTVWVDIASFSKFSVSAVFTGGSPTGTLSLVQSNDLQWTGPIVTPLHVGTSQFPNDEFVVPFGGGQSTASVAGAGAYCFNQYFAPYRWFKVIYTVIGTPSVSQLDIFFTAKD